MHAYQLYLSSLTPASFSVIVFSESAGRLLQHHPGGSATYAVFPSYALIGPYGCEVVGGIHSVPMACVVYLIAALFRRWGC